MSKKVAPMYKISTTSSIYFDFNKKKLYVQNFGGPFSHNDYSKSNTFWGGQALICSVTVLGLALDKYFIFPVITSLLCSAILGISIGKILSKIMTNISLRQREYKRFTREKVIEIIKRTRKTAWTMRLFLIFLYISTFISILIYILNYEMNGKNVIIVAMSFFLIVVIQDIMSPRLAFKALKILKKQLKAGKFDSKQVTPF